MSEAVSPESDLLLQTAARKKPAWWIENILGKKLWSKQQEIAQSVFDNLRTTVKAAEGVGKSFIASSISLAFFYNFYPCTFITTAPTWRQVEEIIWREIAGAYSSARRPLAGSLTRARLDVAEDWFGIGLSTDQPERFQGFHNTNVLVVGDEASGLSEQVYQAMENPMSTGNAHMLLISNPTQPVGSFRNTFTSSIYNPISISAFDTPNFTGYGITIEDIRTGEWKDKMLLTKVEEDEGTWRARLPFPSLVHPFRVAERLEEWGEGSYQWKVFVLGEFPDAGINNLIPWQDIEAAIDKEVNTEGDLIASLDVARYGDSETVFMIKKGDKLLETHAWSHQDINFTTGRVGSLMMGKGPRELRIDATAIGGDDASILDMAGFNVHKVLVGSPALDTERFANKRAEIFWNLATKFKNGTISIPNDRKLIGQLADLQFTYRRGKLLIESKEDMRSRGTKSPDRADALAMAFMLGKNRFGSRTVWEY